MIPWRLFFSKPLPACTDKRNNVILPPTLPAIRGNVNHNFASALRQRFSALQISTLFKALSPIYFTPKKETDGRRQRVFTVRGVGFFLSSSFVPCAVSYPWGPGVSFDSTVLPNKHAYKRSHKYTSIIKEPFLSPLPTKLINDYVFNTYIIHGRGRRRG